VPRRGEPFWEGVMLCYGNSLAELLSKYVRKFVVAFETFFANWMRCCFGFL